MIVRWQPHHQTYGDPVTARERTYVRLAWGIRSEKGIARRLLVHRCRVRAIARDLGLGAPPPVRPCCEPGSSMVEVPADILRRCQVCAGLMVCRHCPCGWEAGV